MTYECEAGNCACIMQFPGHHENFRKIHYENTSMQDTAIFHVCKNDNFQFNFFDLFIFCSKHRSWLHTIYVLEQK